MRMLYPPQRYNFANALNIKVQIFTHQYLVYELCFLTLITLIIDDKLLRKIIQKNVAQNLPRIVLQPLNPHHERSPNRNRECETSKDPEESFVFTSESARCNVEICNNLQKQNLPQNTGEFLQTVKKGGSKTYFCVYCKKMYTKLVVHLENMHAKEEEVLQFSRLPKGSYERKKIIECLRKRGCFEYNTNEHYNKGDIIVSRRPCVTNRKVTDYKMCPNCKGYYSKFAIRKHYGKCIPNHEKGNRSLSVLGKVLSAQIHAKASQMLRKVFAVLRDDDVTRIIRYDELVITFGNVLCEKYRLPHLHKMIRSKLRLIGRFLIELKSVDKMIKNYEAVFSPENVDNSIKAINILGGLDPSTQEYKAPATATEMGSILKKCSKLLITLCIKNRLTGKKKNVEEFLQLLEEDLPIFVNKTATETQLKNNRKKKIVLPRTDDISKFNKFIEENIQKYYRHLKNEFNFTAWKELASFTLTSVQVFNRKRAGEVERITIEDYETYQSINLDEIANIVATTDNVYDNAMKYVRFVIRGKKARGVPVLFSEQMLRSVKLILKYREKAGVPKGNPYVFGIPGNSTVFTHLNACSLMRRFSQESGVAHAELLRGTQLRKHLATQSALLDLEECEVGDLANFLGHDRKIHGDNYRIPVAAREINRVSRLLERGIGMTPCTRTKTTATHSQCVDVNINLNHDGTIENACSQDVSHKNPNHDETTQYETLVDDNALEENGSDQSEPQNNRDSWNEDNLESRTEYGRQRCSSPRGKIARKTWTTEEVECAQKIFQEHITNKETPSVPECRIVLANNALLNGRSPMQLKAWVNNQIMKRKNKPTNKKDRWQDTEIVIMNKVFAKNIADGILPGLNFCRETMEQYPALKNRNPTSVKAWINNIIRKKKRSNPHN